MTLDRFTKTMLVVIAVLLGMVAFRPIVHPAPVQAQASEAYPFYLEPGYTMLRKPDGTAQVYGKVAVDMRTGDIWGFPTTVQGPYPIDNAKTVSPKYYPLYLRKFMFSEAMKYTPYNVVFAGSCQDLPLPRLDSERRARPWGTSSEN